MIQQEGLDGTGSLHHASVYIVALLLREHPRNVVQSVVASKVLQTLVLELEQPGSALSRTQRALLRTLHDNKTERGKPCGAMPDAAILTRQRLMTMRCLLRMITGAACRVQRNGNTDEIGQAKHIGQHQVRMTVGISTFVEKVCRFAAAEVHQNAEEIVIDSCVRGMAPRRVYLLQCCVNPLISLSNVAVVLQHLVIERPATRLTLSRCVSVRTMRDIQ